MAMNTSIARIILALGGAAAMAWAVAVVPVFRSEGAVNDVAAGVIAGEAYSPDVLAALEPLTGPDSSLMVRSSLLRKAAVIRLRQAEDAGHSGDAERIEQKFKSAERIVNDALRNAPNDPFLWLVLFSLDSYRHGVEDFRFLQMSYQLGPHEGWIAAKRNGIALANYSVLPNDLAETAISEFVGLVRWGFVPEATTIASGPAQPIRNILFPRLKDLNSEQRQAFATAMYRRGLDDVLVPGIAPPPPPVSLPVLPRDF
jgi:hypothetical protein